MHLRINNDAFSNKRNSESISHFLHRLSGVLKRSLFILSVFACLRANAQSVEPATQTNVNDNKAPVALATEHVTDSDNTAASLTVPTAETAQEELSTLPGGTGLIRTEDILGASTNPADLLSTQPGVHVESAGGRNQADVISVRGAGTSNGGPFGNTTKGVSIFINGLPVTTPGPFAFEAPDALATNYVAVLRGSSSLTYGALSLGGGINYVYHTGYDASPFQFRFDTGSFGYYRAQVSSGHVVGPLDYYVSVTSSHQDGYRDNANGETQSYAFNLGYQFNPNLATRLYLDYVVSNYQNPRVLTEQEMYQNPKQVSPELGTGLHGGLYRNAPGTFILQDKTTLKIGETSSVEASAGFMNFPTATNGSRTNALPLSYLTHNQNGAISAAIVYKRADQLFGKSVDTKVSLTGADLLYAKTQIIGDLYNPNPGIILQKYHNNGEDVVLSESNEIDLLGRGNLLLTPAFALSHKTRSGETSFPAVDSASNHYSNFAPQLGVLYNVTRAIQLYSNVSKLTESPSAQTLSPNIVPTKPSSIPLYDKSLVEQTAVSGELGVKGQFSIFSGGLDYYYQTLRHELLTVATGPTTSATENASPTIHQGVEFNLDTVLWQDKATASPDQIFAGDHRTPSAKRQKPTQVLLTIAYTWADDHFRNDPLLGKNELPGLPPQYYEIDLVYKHTRGFYAGVNLKGSVTSFAIDYANSKGYYANPYSLWGAKAGYVAPSKKWEVYIDFRNLADRTYASVINPIYNATTVANNPASLATFWPGDGFSVTGGFSYRY